MTKIYYKSDIKIFIDSEQFEENLRVPFEFRYYTVGASNYVSCGWDGVNYTNCTAVEGGVLAHWECPNFYPGELMVMRHFYQPDERFSDGVFDLISAEITDIIITDTPVSVENLGRDILYGFKSEPGVDAPYPQWIGDTKPEYTAAEVGAVPLTGGTLSGGGRIAPSGTIFLQQGSGSNAVGLYWQSLDDTRVLGTIGAWTIGDTLKSVFMGWGNDAYAPDNNFSVSENHITYKGYTVYHAGSPQPQTLALTTPMAQSVSFDTQPLAIEQPTEEVEVQIPIEQPQAKAADAEPQYETSVITQAADHWVYRYDITPGDGKFVAKEVKIYDTPSKANITKVVMEAEFGKGYETNLLNDYNAVQLGCIPDTGQTDRYRAFLLRRETLKIQIQKDLGLN